LYNNLLANYQRLCPKFFSRIHGRGLDATPLGDSGLIKRHLLINRRVLNASASYFIGWYFHRKIFNTTKLLNHVAPSVELMVQRLAISYK